LAPSLLLPAWKSPPGPDLRLKRDQTFGLALVNNHLPDRLPTSAPELTCTTKLP
jgi:hypothetical protein